MRVLAHNSTLLPLLFLLIAGPLCAADISWDGGGDNVSWSDANNWSGDVVPGSGDHALITLGGSHTVRLTANTSVARLTLGGAGGVQTLDVSGFHLTLGTGPSVVNANGVLAVGGASANNSFVLTIDGPLAVDGRLDWSNGVIYANTYYQPPNGRVVTVNPGGEMRWIGSGDRNIAATIDNQGTLRWEAGLTYYTQGYSITTSGTFRIDLADDATFARAGVNSQGPWVFTNTGTVRKTGAGKATLQVELRTIDGSVDVLEDTLMQNYASRWERATVSVAAGATLLLTANGAFEPHTVADTLSGTIDGTFLVFGLQTYHTTLTADPATGGAVDIGGTGIQLDQVDLGGVYDPSSKTYSPAPVNLGLMRFTGGRQNFISGPFVNKDTLRWEGGRLFYYINSSFANEKLFEMAIDDTLDFLTGGVNGGRPGPFLNTGTVVKTGAGRVKSTVDFHTIGGTVDVRSGELIQEDRSRWENATVAVAAGATLWLGGYLREHVVAGRLQGDPQGTFLVSGLVYSYNTLLMADTVLGGRMELGGTGVQIIDCELGGTDGRPTPVNGGLLRFVGVDNQYIQVNFRNEGRVQWEKGNLRMRSGVTVTNTGLVEISAAGVTLYGSGFTGVATLANEVGGTIRKIDTGTVNLFISIINRGRLAIAGGTVIVESAFNNLNVFTSTAEGVLAGVGVLDLSRLMADHLTNDGTTAPGPGDDGAGVGTFTIRGPIPFRLFDLELAGPDSTEYDHLIVTSNAPDISLDTAFVRIVNGFVPVQGQHFDVVIGPVVGELAEVIVTPSGVELTDTYPVNLVRLVIGNEAPNDEKTIVVIAPEVAARQGETVTIPMTVIASAGARNGGATEVTVTLRFNATLLVPIDSTPRGRIEAGERVIDLRIPVGSSSDTTTAPFRFKATLGNDSTTALALGNPATNAAGVTVLSVDGVFRLLDLCREGGARLLNPDGVVAVSKVRSNPLSGTISFDLDLIETGVTKIMLGNINGQIVRTFINEELPRGRRTVRLDTEEIAAGRYFLIVRTPTVRLIEQVEVTR